MKETLVEKLSRLENERQNLIVQRYEKIVEYDKLINEKETQISFISQEINRIQLALS